MARNWVFCACSTLARPPGFPERDLRRPPVVKTHERLVSSKGVVAQVLRCEIERCYHNSIMKMNTSPIQTIRAEVL